jgi:hypothetical protein
MKLSLLTIVLGAVRVCATPVVLERQTMTADAATVLTVVALIMEYDLQPWCTTWIANVTKYISLLLWGES